METIVLDIPQRFIINGDDKVDEYISDSIKVVWNVICACLLIGDLETVEFIRNMCASIAESKLSKLGRGGIP